MLWQRTLRDKVSCRGVGLHSGREITLELLPAPADNGVTFVRTDMKRHAELRACVEHVAETTLATTLAAGVNGSRAVVGTVEHLLAALSGLGVDNVRVHLDGPEVPILDGSAGPFVEMLLRVGLESQNRPKKFIAIRREVRVEDGQKEASMAPGRGFSITASVDFDHPLIPPTPYRFAFSERAFRREIANARTFGFYRDVEALRERGLVRGGSLENAVVIDEYRVLNAEGLRFPDEFVRHKILDAIGDLSLFGLPVIGSLHLHRSGHALNTALVRKVLSDPRCYEVIEPELSAAGPQVVADLGQFPVFEPVESLA